MHSQSDRETGAEPSTLQLFKIAHTQQGIWSGHLAEKISVSNCLIVIMLPQYILLFLSEHYINCTFIVSFPQTQTSWRLSTSESNEQEESTYAAADPVEEDQAFQETNLEAAGAKSSMSLGHGYMPTRSNKRIFQDRLEDQKKKDSSTSTTDGTEKC